jgi:sarcosine oxidase subunit gamma
MTVKTIRPTLDSRVALRLPEAPAILHVLASRGKCGSVAEKLGRMAAAGSFSLRAAGPDKWLALAPAAEAFRLMAELRNELAGSASLLDQSDGRVLVELSGSEAREALAKGTGVDLDPNVFPVGHSTVTAFGHLTVHLARTGAGTYELIVTRSYAEALWDMLIEAAREFGCDAPRQFPGSI